MAVPKLPKWRVRITDAARTDAITNFRTALFYHHVVDGVYKHLLNMLDFGLAKN